MDKEKLKTTPWFDQNAKWLDFANRTWETAFKYYGYDLYWKLQVIDFVLSPEDIAHEIVRIMHTAPSPV